MALLTVTERRWGEGGTAHQRNRGEAGESAGRL